MSYDEKKYKSATIQEKLAMLFKYTIETAFKFDGYKPFASRKFQRNFFTGAVDDFVSAATLLFVMTMTIFMIALQSIIMLSPALIPMIMFIISIECHNATLHAFGFVIWVLSFSFAKPMWAI
jgi:hypothetical protein